MIPAGGSIRDTVLTEPMHPDKTYRLDMQNGRISGTVDGADAVKQAVMKMLHTGRYDHFIYSADYGSELKGLIGADFSLVRSELKRRINEALLQDTRITGIEHFEVTAQGEDAVVSFTVVSLYGSFDVEVTVDV